MAATSISVTIRTKSQGFTGVSPEADFLVMGTSSAGTAAGTAGAYIYEFSDVENIRSTVGVGPGAELCAQIVSSGANRVFFCKTGATTAAVTSAVTSSGTTPPLVTVSGTPNDSYLVRVEVTTAGSQTTCKLRYSLDDGITWVETVTGAASVVLYCYDPKNSASKRQSTGLTLALPVGSYSADNVYKFYTHAGCPDSTNLSAAFTLAVGDPRKWGVVILANSPNGSVSDAANLGAANTLLTAFSTGMGQLQNAYKFARGLGELPNTYQYGAQDSTWEAAVITALTASSDRLTVACGHALMSSALTIGNHWRAVSFFAAQRMSNVVRISQKISAVAAGGLPVIQPGSAQATNVLTYVGNIARGVTRDEVSGTTMTGFLTLRTRAEKNDRLFYFSSDSTKTDPTSDFKFLVFGRIMDLFTDTVVEAAADYVDAEIEVFSATGKITEKQAQLIEGAIAGKVSDRMLNNAYVMPPTETTPFITVNRSNNIISTGELRLTCRCTPPAYATTISVDLGFNVTGRGV